MLPLALLLAALSPAADAPHWFTDYDQARKEARAANKPIFVVFRCEF
jgi:hypothetical protein